jgi:hypothetical protein
MGEREVELELHSIRTHRWMVIGMYGLAKCTAHKLSNAAFYKKEILQPTLGEEFLGSAGSWTWSTVWYSKDSARFQKLEVTNFSTFGSSLHSYHSLDCF